MHVLGGASYRRTRQWVSALPHFESRQTLRVRFIIFNLLDNLMKMLMSI